MNYADENYAALLRQAQAGLTRWRQVRRIEQGGRMQIGFGFANRARETRRPVEIRNLIVAAFASQVFAEGAKLANQVEQAGVVEFLRPVCYFASVLPNRMQLPY